MVKCPALEDSKQEYQISRDPNAIKIDEDLQFLGDEDTQK